MSSSAKMADFVLREFFALLVLAGVASGIAASGQAISFSKGFKSVNGALAPSANDTSMSSYLEDIDQKLTIAGKSTPAPVSANAPPKQPEKEPWKKIYDARQSYDMALGAAILYNLNEKNTPTPPPTQDYVTAQFVAQCPLVMFGDQVYIKAPRCGNSMGSWNDPETDRAILRWDKSNEGGITYNVDSAVSGDGSVRFAEVKEEFSWNSYNFNLFNCLGVKRYTIVEKTIKVNKMGAGRSTFRMHDTAESKVAYFLRYEIQHPNGSTVAQTGMFRQHDKQVNITTNNNEISPGSLLATATREGYWKKDGWRQCTESPREWHLNFVQPATSMDQPSTVMDLRVATGILITMMAVRDEHRDVNGLNDEGQGTLVWGVVGTWIFAIIVVIAAGLFIMFFLWTGLQHWLRDRLFKFEAAFFPKRPPKVRNPPMHAAW
eukprot:gnl/TRDRNA2_/TRDRNA2_180190_c0_seq1.p1 gnl/TRDRNA2_/TRDRNA2_180190_c0~~gnl/TRDRNA2_/TRDRNA2_180190_c0_seq1.p1  ORF type:complete len:457 (-),score=85.76 gnl/TRDRNA2_/TRDRNA2_180190_c0_seq1:67-1365(-)